MADNGLFKLKIISPDRVFYEGEAVMVEMSTTEGDIGVYKNHIPLTTMLAPGVLTITEESGLKNAAVHAGFVEILQDEVIVLAEVAEWPDEIDLNRAEEAKKRAERRLKDRTPDTNIARAETALHRAIARIETLKK